MGRESAGALAREQGLRLEDERVHVPVAHPPLQDVIVRDDAKPSALGIAREGPQGHEVRTTHVTREERGDDLETMTPRGVGHGHEERKGAIADRRRLRLEVLPQQEEPDELAARVTDAREIAIDLARVEPPPPAHRARRRPVVDTDLERLAHAIRAPDTIRSYTRR